jgi:hypothetical protein
LVGPLVLRHASLGQNPPSSTVRSRWAIGFTIKEAENHQRRLKLRALFGTQLRFD